MLLLLVVGLGWWTSRLPGERAHETAGPVEERDPARGVGLEPPSVPTGRDAQRTGDEAAPTATARVPWFLRGRVLDLDGRPVRDAVVHASVRRGAERTTWPAVAVDEEGAYHLDLAAVTAWPRLVRATAYLTVYADAQGFLPSEEEEFQLANHVPGTAWSQDHHLERGSRVMGRVLDASSTALPGAEVTLGDPGSILGAGDVTDAEGRYAFRVAKGGRYRLVAAWGDHEAVAESLDVALGADVLVRDVVVPVTAGFVEGVVERADGQGVEGILVVSARDEPAGRNTADPPTAVSGEGGRFRMLLPELGTYHLWAHALADSSPSVECRAGDQVRLALPACTFVVHVVAPDGTPLAGADLSYEGWPASEAPPVEGWVSGTCRRDEAATPASWGFSGEGAAQAGVETQYVDADTVWFVVARVAGGLPAEAAVRIGGRESEVDVTLVVRDAAPTGTLAFEVIAPDATPITDCTVEVETLAGTSLARVRSAALGQPVVVPAGRVRIVVQPHASGAGIPAHAPLGTFLLPIEQVIEVRADTTQALRLHAKEGGRFELVLRTLQGRLPNLGSGSVSVRPRDKPDAPLRSVDGWIDTDAGWRRTNLWTPNGAHLNAHLLEPGEYVLVVRPDALHAYEAVLAIREGDVTQVVIDVDG